MAVILYFLLSVPPALLPFLGNREGQVEEPMEGRPHVQEDSEVTRQDMRSTQGSEALSTAGVLPTPGSSSLCGSHR